MRSIIIVVIQLVLTIVLLLSAYLIKAVGSDTYSYIHNMYYKNINAEVLVDLSEN